MAEITNKIKVYRAQNELTQEDLAKKAGVTRQTIIAIEKGKYVPSLQLAFQIARVFSEDINNIFKFE